MKIITNAVIDQASGKLGTSIVLYRSLARQCARMYVIPTNPQSALQVLCREAMSQASKWWSTTLTDSDRQAWQEFAAYVSERSGQLGLKYRRTGQQLATASAQLAGLTGSETTYYELPVLPSAVPTPLGGTASYKIATNTLTLTVIYPTVAAPMDAYYLPRLVTASSGAQTPTLAKSRMLLNATGTAVNFGSVGVGGIKGPVSLTVATYPTLAKIATATEAYIYISTRAANSGLENTTPFKIPVSIVP